MMATIVREIELRPHVGRTMAGTEVVFAQDQIFLNGMRIGYIGHQPGDGICLIRPVDADTLAEIKRVVDEKFGERDRTVAAATPISDERDEADDE